MKETTFSTDKPPSTYQDGTSASHHRLVEWITTILPVLIIGIIGGSLFGLQWAGQRGITLGYPQPQVHIAALPTSTLIRTQNNNFSATASGRDLSYLWSFGDQSTDSGAIVNHIYQSNGTFTVTVTVTDPAGHQATQAETVTVVPPAPQASFTVSSGYDGYTYFDASSSSADSSTSIASYNWDFGDGSPTSITGYPQSSHYYTTGTYQVTLTVIDATGQASNAYTTTITI
jgi:PKD repeat protein